jgi:hypothetical protein
LRVPPSGTGESLLAHYKAFRFWEAFSLAKKLYHRETAQILNFY